ncbi:hypothetical protein ZWY2020_052113 [Hordeum vulgare]|nr:hypothetical protein ZWY2020_052113 [Hordeum vulgare]
MTSRPPARSVGSSPARRGDRQHTLSPVGLSTALLARVPTAGSSRVDSGRPCSPCGPSAAVLTRELTAGSTRADSGSSRLPDGPLAAMATSPREQMLDPSSPPWIWLRGECSRARTGGDWGAIVDCLEVSSAPTEASPAPPSSATPASVKSPVLPELPMPRLQARLKSIVVALSRDVSAEGGAWNEVSYQKSRRRADGPAGHGDSPGRHSSGRLAVFSAEQARLAFLSKFRGRCFRCLNTRHKVAGCREPIHCITCKRAGHISRHCPKHPKFTGRAGSAKSRLGPVPPAQSLYARLRFPPPQEAMSAPAASLLLQADAARRPRDS